MQFFGTAIQHGRRTQATIALSAELELYAIGRAAQESLHINNFIALSGYIELTLQKLPIVNKLVGVVPGDCSLTSLGLDFVSISIAASLMLIRK